MTYLTLQSLEAIIVPQWIIWSWYTGRWWVGCYIWYSKEGTGWGRSLPRPLLAVPNVTAYPSTASVPITVLVYNGPLLCGFNVPIKGLMDWITISFNRHKVFRDYLPIWIYWWPPSQCMPVTLRLEIRQLSQRLTQKRLTIGTLAQQLTEQNF